MDEARPRPAREGSNDDAPAFADSALDLPSGLPPDEPYEGEVALGDEAPLTPATEADEPHSGDSSVERLLRDETTARASDEGELAPDAAAEADLLDAAPREPGEPEELAPPPRPTAPRAFTGARGEPALPPRRVAKRSARDELMGEPAPRVASQRQGQPERVASERSRSTLTPGVAECPACRARNPHDARQCGRCGAEIPPPIPPGRPQGLTPGAVVAHTSAATRGEGDPLEVLPPEVRERVLAARAASQAHTQRAIEREVRRTRSFIVAFGLVALVFGFVVSQVIVPGGWGKAACAVVDAGLGAAAGWAIYHFGGTTLRGMLIFGPAAIISGGVKLALHPGFDLSLVGAFAVLVPFVYLSTIVGAYVGRRIDDLTYEDGT